MSVTEKILALSMQENYMLSILSFGSNSGHRLFGLNHG